MSRGSEVKNPFEGKEKIQLHELKGFREPTERECDLITDYLVHEIRIAKRGHTGLLIGYTLIVLIVAGIVSVSKIDDPMERFLTVFILGLFLALWCSMVHAISEYGREIRAAKAKKYKVLDCKAVSLTIDAAEDSTVKAWITDGSGNYCWRPLILDRVTANLCKSNMDTPLLLIKCRTEFRLQSETSLKERKYGSINK